MAQILALIPYIHFYPPRNGGQLRAFYTLRELARDNEVVAITFQPVTDFSKSANGYQLPDSIKFYSPGDTPPPQTLFNHAPSRLGPGLHYRWLQRSLRGPASSILLQTFHLIPQLLKQHPIDAVVLTTIASMNATAPLIKRSSPQAICIVNTENIEHHLLSQQMESSGTKAEKDHLKERYQEALWLETHLTRYVDAFFACSDGDRDTLAALNRGKVPGYTIPNGVDTERKLFNANPTKQMLRDILFCGSLETAANRDGVQWFYENSWRRIRAKLPDARFVVVGIGASADSFPELRNDPTVEFVGAVDDVAPYYYRTALSIIPLRQGSGTRLKILESMSFGNPVVSTRVGAQGISAKDGEHLLLADSPDEFADAVVRLMSSPAQFDRMRRAARALVEREYDWRVIGARMNQVVAELVAQRAQDAQGKR